MKTKNIYFISNRREKYEEMKKMFDLPGFELKWHEGGAPELQTEDEKELIKEKVCRAFEELRRPVLVEHTAFQIQAFKELPGLQTGNFYKKIGGKDIVEFCRMKNNFGAKAVSILGFCDGKSIQIQKGEEKGEIVRDASRIRGGFDWDAIFIPSKDNPKMETYAEMGRKKKNKRSMRKLAWEQMRQNVKNADTSLWEEENEDQIDALAQLIAEKKVMLFVGAGISASVKLPTWEKFIDNIAEEEDIESNLFKCYGNYMMLAEYADNEKELAYRCVKNKFDIDDEIEIQKKLYKSKIYRKIFQLDVPVIYTTNFDQLIEKYYEKQEPGKAIAISKLSDMQDIQPEKTRIMKFHGDVKHADTIVLSESQYYERMDFRNFMDIQLQADMLQYSVLFLGYSLSDINVKLLLYLAQKKWKTAGDKKELESEEQTERKSYIFTATPNYVQKEVFRKNGIVSLSSDIPDKKKGTLEFLKKLNKLVEKKRKEQKN